MVAEIAADPSAAEAIVGGKQGVNRGRSDRASREKQAAGSEERTARGEKANRKERRAEIADRREAKAEKRTKPSRAERGYTKPRGKKDDWKQFFQHDDQPFRGPEPDFSEEGWAKPSKKKK